MLYRVTLAWAVLSAVAADELHCDASKGRCPSSLRVPPVLIQVKGSGDLKQEVAKSETYPSAGIPLQISDSEADNEKEVGSLGFDNEVGSLSDGLGGGGGLADCCTACSQYCSPKSSNCYDARNKDYYAFCDVPGILQVTVGELVWSDEFDGSGGINGSKWTPEVLERPFNNERQFYTDRDANAFREDGILKVVAKCENYNGAAFTSARLITKGKASWGPGHRVEVKAKAPNAEGTWPAIWMMPNSNRYGSWPHSGEIDIMESVGCDPGRIFGTVHTGAYNHMKGTQKGGHLDEEPGEWHVYTIDWLDTQIQWYVDGELYHTFYAEPDGTQYWPFQENFYLILNVAVGGDWGGNCLTGAPTCGEGGHFPEDQVMEVDYAKVWAISS